MANNARYRGLSAKKTVTRKVRLVITATRSNDVDQFNQTQYQTDFKKYSYSRMNYYFIRERYYYSINRLKRSNANFGTK
jgi:hypothetical protein